MLKKCSAVTFSKQKQRLTVRWWQRCSCLARVSLRRDACRSPSVHCDYWKRRKRVINSSPNNAGMSKTWEKWIKMHYSWTVDRIGQVCLTPDEELLVHQIKIKDVMWRKQQLKGPRIRWWQSYILGRLRSAEIMAKRKIESFHQILVLRVAWVKAHLDLNISYPDVQALTGFYGSSSTTWWHRHSFLLAMFAVCPHMIRTPGQVELSHLHLLWQQWISTKTEIGQFGVWSGWSGVWKSQ